MPIALPSLLTMLALVAPPQPLDTLLQPNGASGDEAGRSIAVDGRRLLLGVPYTDLQGATNRGSAWVFRATADGTWIPEAQLTAPDGAAQDELGLSVALDGDVAIVGALSDDVGPKTNAGSASIFRRVNGAWTFEATIIASDGASNDEFGRSVAIRGDVALVGAWMSGLFDNGAVYVFKRQSNGSWLQTQKLTPPGSASGDNFGTTLAFDGARAIAGAWGDEDGPLGNTGSASVFRLNDAGNFVFEAKLIGADVQASDELGRGVAIDDDLAVVGSWPFFGDGVGKAYAFRRTGTTWVQEAKFLAANGAADDYFGFSVACKTSPTGDIVACGSWADDVNGVTNQGSVSVFRKIGSSWDAGVQLIADDGGASDYFGFSLALSCELLAVGVRLDDVARATNHGSARVWWIDDANANDQPELCQAPADLNGDGVVNASDLAALLGAWGSTEGTSSDADIDGDNDVDAADLAELLAGWTS